MPGRQPQPQLQLLVRPAPRLAVPLLHPAGAARLLPRLRRRLRPARPHPLPHRGAVGHLVRRRRALDRRAAGARRRRDRRRRRRHQRRRAAQPAPHARDPRPRHVRRPRVPLGAVAPRRRPDRQARGGHRHRGQRHAAHPRDRPRGRRAAGVPAHAGVDGAHARVPRRRARRADLALPARALVQRVQPVLHLLADGRRRPRERARRPRLGPARLGRTHERHGADAVHRVPEGRVRRPARPARGVHPHLPGRRQADDPRQRRVGARARSATTSAWSRAASPRSRPTASSAPTARGTTST